jgi:hypothetical protein
MRCMPHPPVHGYTSRFTAQTQVRSCAYLAARRAASLRGLTHHSYTKFVEGRNLRLMAAADEGGEKLSRSKLDLEYGQGTAPCDDGGVSIGAVARATCCCFCLSSPVVK